MPIGEVSTEAYGQLLGILANDPMNFRISLNCDSSTETYLGYHEKAPVTLMATKCISVINFGMFERIGHGQNSGDEMDPKISVKSDIRPWEGEQTQMVLPSELSAFKTYSVYKWRRVLIDDSACHLETSRLMLDGDKSMCLGDA